MPGWPEPSARRIAKDVAEAYARASSRESRSTMSPGRSQQALPAGARRRGHPRAARRALQPSLRASLRRVPRARLRQPRAGLRAGRGGPDQGGSGPPAGCPGHDAPGGGAPAVTTSHREEWPRDGRSRGRVGRCRGKCATLPNPPLPVPFIVHLLPDVRLV
jgi:hypothetical protein